MGKKICIFGYNFKHWKTQTGIINLALSGHKPDFVILQNWKKLKIPQSTLRISPKDLYLFEPSTLLKNLDIPYIICDHNSEECIQFLSSQGFDLGVILGARILSKSVIQQFEKGILNLHPGLLPENRGLDTIKWAVLKNLKQGVTSHIIDEKIDRGTLISRKQIKIYEDDTLIDLNIRIQNLEQEMMIDAVKKILLDDFGSGSLLERGDYNSHMNKEDELRVINNFANYKNLILEKKNAIDY